MPYTLIRSRKRKKTLSIQVKEDCSVLVHVPFYTSCAEIDRFLAAKRHWLQRKIAEQQHWNNEQRRRAYVPGEQFLYLGNAYTLKIAEGDTPHETLHFTGREFILGRNALKGVRVLFCLWYQQQARTHLDASVSYYSRLVGAVPRRIATGNARSRWGSCSADNRLTFAWRLIMAPPEVINYVVVHELCHIKIRNHSREYWRLVEEILPGFRQQAAWLKNQGRLLSF